MQRQKTEKSFRPDCSRSICGPLSRGTLCLLLACCLIATTGCSVFVATPRVAHVQVKNLNDKVEEYVIVLDDQPETDLGIQLTDRHTIKLDFQWLWDRQKEHRDTDAYHLYDDSAVPPTPWFRCIYRF